MAAWKRCENVKLVAHSDDLTENYCFSFNLLYFIVSHLRKKIHKSEMEKRNTVHSGCEVNKTNRQKNSN